MSAVIERHLDEDVIQQGQPRDFLGHPCRIAEAYDQYKDAATEAREDHPEDRRFLARTVGRHLVQLGEKVEHLAFLLDAVIQLLPNADDEMARAVLEAGSEYAMGACTTHFNLAGEVLVLLEYANLAKDGRSTV